MCLLLLFISTLLSDTASTEAYVQGHFGQATMSLSGTQNAGFAVGAQSVYDISSRHRVYGEASYTWNQSRGNRWVENADWEKVYPYLTCDTVGGGMRTERYYFRGGYRMLLPRFMWGVSLSFRALQSYREVDPRPNNKVADMDLQCSAAYVTGEYAIGGTIGAGRYKQTNTMKFYSELGEALIYHLVTPSADYSRFTGSQKQAYYHGWGAQSALWLTPTSNGWAATLSYQYDATTKELLDNTYFPLGTLTVHQVALEAGYRQKHWQVMLQGGVNLRRGKQQLYGEVANSYYYPLAARTTYAQNDWILGASGSYTAMLPFGQLTAAGEVVYTYKQSVTTLSANPLFTDLASDLTSHHTDAALSLRYAFPLRGRYQWFVRTQAEYTFFHTTSRYTWLTALATGISF